MFPRSRATKASLPPAAAEQQLRPVDQPISSSVHVKYKWWWQCPAIPHQPPHKPSLRQRYDSFLSQNMSRSRSNCKSTMRAPSTLRSAQSVPVVSSVLQQHSRSRQVVDATPRKSGHSLSGDAVHGASPAFHTAHQSKNRRHRATLLAQGGQLDKPIFNQTCEFASMIADRNAYESLFSRLSSAAQIQRNAIDTSLSPHAVEACISTARAVDRCVICPTPLPRQLPSVNHFPSANKQIRRQSASTRAHAQRKHAVIPDSNHMHKATVSVYSKHVPVSHPSFATLTTGSTSISTRSNHDAKPLTTTHGTGQLFVHAHYKSRVSGKMSTSLLDYNLDRDMRSCQQIKPLYQPLSILDILRERCNT
jgi:hypothetical protein